MPRQARNLKSSFWTNLKLFIESMGETSWEYRERRLQALEFEMIKRATPNSSLPNIQRTYSGSPKPKPSSRWANIERLLEHPNQAYYESVINRITLLESQLLTSDIFNCDHAPVSDENGRSNHFFRKTIIAMIESYDEHLDKRISRLEMHLAKP